ncbi:hypothetical protein [Bradyrhizobium sp. Ce-3]|uniref:hypothetical protein n=1 Tax=Bradyrhizobium sp. Ce-3 TaxID=2913970 RepID=UPI001FC81197|nr:hypothetical protein [Bradyrhizobium sp. Ce-3]GKQ51388.1 hypothetical protein BRSPCE3_22430 [Bradyrhizobium sp. Ce-3]
MGRIIDLQQFRNRIGDVGESEASGRQSKADPAAALSACRAVRRQIGTILEITVAIEELIERHAAAGSRQGLLERLWVSRQDFITAFEKASATIEVLSKVTFTAHQATTPADD